MRNIDWNVTARKNEPHTKVFTEEREKPTLIVVDQSQSMFFGAKMRLKSVAAAEIAARLAWFTLAQKDRVGGIVFNEQSTTTTKPFRNRVSVLQLLSTIVTANTQLNVSTRGLEPQAQSKAATFATMIRQVRLLAQHQHRIYVISDFRGLANADVEQLLSHGKHNELRLILIYDALEQVLPPANHYSVTDGENLVRFHSAHPRIREEYRQRFNARVNDLQRLSASQQVTLNVISTTDAMDTFVLN